MVDSAAVSRVPGAAALPPVVRVPLLEVLHLLLDVLLHRLLPARAHARVEALGDVTTRFIAGGC